MIARIVAMMIGYRLEGLRFIVGLQQLFAAQLGRGPATVEIATGQDCEGWTILHAIFFERFRRLVGRLTRNEPFLPRPYHLTHTAPTLSVEIFAGANARPGFTRRKKSENK
jgi:hypothetical protein